MPGTPTRFLLLSGGCVDLGSSGLAFAPFTAALRGLLRETGIDGVASLLPGGAPVELGRLLPALAGPVRVIPRHMTAQRTAMTPSPARGYSRSCSACWRASPTSGRWF